MSRFTQNLVLALCGAVTSAITAAILVFIELKWDWALYSYSFWVIIPAGAICAGFGAASGYYFGARWLNFRPGKDLLVGMTAISAGTFFFIYWLEWMFMTVDGNHITGLISYTEFLNLVITHTTMSFGYRGHFVGNGVDVGAGGGYFFAVLQVIGFAIGGFATYGYLVSLPYCKDCGLYFKDKGKQTRFFGDSDSVSASTQDFLAKAGEQRFQDSIQIHAESGSPKIVGKAAFNSSIELKRCNGCEKHFMNFGVKRWDGKDWKDISELNYATYLMERVEIPKSLAP